MKATAWKGGFDVTAGAALEVFGFRSGASRKPRLWLTAEGGYGWTASNSMQCYEPDEPMAAPQRTQAPIWRILSLSGPLFKSGAALSFW